MKCFKLIIFMSFLGVKGEVITTGLVTSSGTEELKMLIGPAKDSVQKNKENEVSNFAAKYGIQLKTREEDVTNEENFVRPCKCEDIECIRQFLAKNSDCEPVYQPVPDPWRLTQNTVFYPSTNLTLTFVDSEISGLSNSKIVEFYYNKKTRKVVLTFEAINITEAAPEACFGYQRVARETLVLCDELNVMFKSITITVIIPILPELRLDLAEAHAYVADGNPLFYIGPKAVTSQDPIVMATFAALLESVPILVREYFLFKAQLWAAFYVQTICDFSVELISI